MACRQYAETYAQGKVLLTLADQASAELYPVLVVAGNYVMGVTTFWQGEFLLARQHLERALATYDVKQHDIYITLFPQNLGIVCLIRLAYLLWYLGYPHLARHRCEEALIQSRKLATRLP